MKILITGRYQPDYNRNSIVFEGLKNLGADLITYRYDKKNRQTAQNLKAYNAEVDFIYIPAFMHMDVGFVRRNTSKPLIFDPLISRYMSKVLDYKQVFPYSIRALKNYLKDYLMMKKADVVLADTHQHINYYHKVIKVPREKLYVLPVGVDTSRFFPLPPQPDHSPFKVGFYGSFIPLHGIEVIIEAAHLLQDETEIVFEIVGNGFMEKKIKKQLKKSPLRNIILKDWVDYQHLNETINSFDICLGIFGEGIKPSSVIPNKVYHYAACGKCIITRDTPAIKEVFSDHTDIMLTEGHPQALADKILKVWKNPILRNKIGHNSLRLMQEHYSQDIIAQTLIDIYRKHFQVQKNPE